MVARRESGKATRSCIYFKLYMAAGVGSETEAGMEPICAVIRVGSGVQAKMGAEIRAKIAVQLGGEKERNGREKGMREDVNWNEGLHAYLWKSR